MHRRRRAFGAFQRSMHTLVLHSTLPHPVAAERQMCTRRRGPSERDHGTGPLQGGWGWGWGWGWGKGRKRDHEAGPLQGGGLRNGTTTPSQLDASQSPRPFPGWRPGAVAHLRDVLVPTVRGFGGHEACTVQVQKMTCSLKKPRCNCEKRCSLGKEGSCGRGGGAGALSPDGSIEEEGCAAVRNTDARLLTTRIV